jgi:hypothetical protein
MCVHVCVFVCLYVCVCVCLIFFIYLYNDTSHTWLFWTKKYKLLSRIYISVCVCVCVGVGVGVDGWVGRWVGV